MEIPRQQVPQGGQLLNIEKFDLIVESKKEFISSQLMGGPVHFCYKG